MRKSTLISLFALALAPIIILGRGGMTGAPSALSPDSVDSTASAAALASALAAAALRASPELDEELGPPLHDTHRTTLAGSIPQKLFGGTPWAPPGKLHPRGTLLLAYSERTSGPQVVEWDLARDVGIRQRPLGLSTKLVDMAIARVGASIVVVSGAPGESVVATLLSSDLAVGSSVEIGRGSGAVIAANDKEIYVSWLEESGTAISLARLDPKNATVRARGTLQLEKPSEGASFAVGQILLVGEDVWLRDYPQWGLTSFSADLLPRRHQARFDGDLFLRDGAAWAVYRNGSHARLVEMDEKFAEQPRGHFAWPSAWPFSSTTHDAQAGLGFSDGRVTNPAGKTVQFADFSMVPTVFWAHGYLIGLAPSESEGYAQVLWAGGE